MTGKVFHGWVEGEGVRARQSARRDRHACLGDLPDERSRPAVWREFLDRPGSVGGTQASGSSTDLRPFASAARGPLPFGREVASPRGWDRAIPPERAGPGRYHLQTRNQRPHPVLRQRRRTRDEPPVRAPLGVPRYPPSRVAYPETDGRRAARDDRQGPGNQPAARVVSSAVPRESRASPASRRAVSRRERPSLMPARFTSNGSRSPLASLSPRGLPETVTRRCRFADRDEIGSTRVRLWHTARCRILKAWRVLRQGIASPGRAPRIPRHRLPGRLSPGLHRPHLRGLADEDRGLRDAEGLVPPLHRDGLRTLLRGLRADSEDPVPPPSRDRAFSLVSDWGPARRRVFDRSNLQFLVHPGPLEDWILGPGREQRVRDDVFLLSDR